MPTSPTVSAAGAEVGAIARWHPHDKAKLAGARRDLRAAKLEAHIRSVVDTFPPLTPEQRDRLAVLLRGTRTPDTGDAA